MDDQMANRIAQGVITGLILIGLFWVVIFIIRKKSRKNNYNSASATANGTSGKISFFQAIANKGVRRLLIALGVLLPLIIASFMCYSESRVIENRYGEILRFYDESIFFSSFFLSLISYWVLLFVGIWIYKGFQESKS